MRGVNSHLNFDLDLAKDESDENPVYYLQYAHARICNILKHANDLGFEIQQNVDLSYLSLKLFLIANYGNYYSHIWL